MLGKGRLCTIYIRCLSFYSLHIVPGVSLYFKTTALTMTPSPTLKEQSDAVPEVNSEGINNASAPYTPFLLPALRFCPPPLRFCPPPLRFCPPPLRFCSLHYVSGHLRYVSAPFTTFLPTSASLLPTSTTLRGFRCAPGSTLFQVSLRFRVPLCSRFHFVPGSTALQSPAQGMMKCNKPLPALRAPFP